MSSDQEDILAAQRDRESHIGWFADPIFKGAYPDMLWKHYEKRGVTLPTIESSDMDVISVPVDFLGVNYYRASVIRNAPGGNWPYDNAYAPCEAEKRT